MRNLLIAAAGLVIAASGIVTARPAAAGSTTGHVTVHAVRSYSDGWKAAKVDDAGLLGHRMPNAEEVQELHQARLSTGRGYSCHLEWDGPTYLGYEAICAHRG